MTASHDVKIKSLHRTPVAGGLLLQQCQRHTSLPHLQAAPEAWTKEGFPSLRCHTSWPHHRAVDGVISQGLLSSSLALSLSRARTHCPGIRSAGVIYVSGSTSAWCAAQFPSGGLWDLLTWVDVLGRCVDIYICMYVCIYIYIYIYICIFHMPHLKMQPKLHSG